MPIDRRKNNNPMKRYLNMITILFLLSACCGSKEAYNQHSETKITEKLVETIKDSTVLIAEDSSSAVAILSADSLGKISISSISVKAGKRVAAPSVELKNNRLTVDCRSQAQEIFLRWKERFLNSYKQKTDSNVIHVPAEIPQWRVALEWVGGLASLSLLLIAAFRIKNFFKNRNNG
jgi:hypothetical protein